MGGVSKARGQWVPEYGVVVDACLDPEAFIKLRDAGEQVQPPTQATQPVMTETKTSR
jgi:hypothetical protein